MLKFKIILKDDKEYELEADRAYMFGDCVTFYRKVSDENELVGRFSNAICFFVLSDIE